MDNDMSYNQLPLTLIVAATSKSGIGKSGGLPWPMLKKDMAYFARVTKRVPLPTNTGSAQFHALKKEDMSAVRRNVVIMGRKTWDSIPSKFRPLKDRTHIVISTQDRSKLQPIPDDVVVAADIVSGLQGLETLVQEGKALPVGRAFVIGGSTIYKSALDLAQTNRILLTKVSQDYDCDTFFPVSLNAHVAENGWKRASHTELREYVSEDIEDGLVPQDVGDERVDLEFQLYVRM